MKIAGILLHPEAGKLLGRLTQTPPHAILLGGSLGIGKTHIARSLAAELLQTTDLTPDNNAYYREVVPIKNAITIEQVRALIRFFRLQVPGTAKVRRVAVVQDADTMGTEAQNALLKLLEEPPEGSVLILTSSHADGLLPTIRSRVQLSNLPSPVDDTILAYFTDLGQPAATMRQLILRHGSNIAAIASEVSSTQNTDSSVGLVKQALSADTYGRLLLVDQLVKQKETARAFVETLSQVASASIAAAAAKQSASLEKWQSILKVSYDAANALERNGSTKLALTELMLSL